MVILLNISRMAAKNTSLYNPRGPLERNGAVTSLVRAEETVLAISKLSSKSGTIPRNNKYLFELQVWPSR